MKKLTSLLLVTGSVLFQGCTPGGTPPNFSFDGNTASDNVKPKPGPQYVGDNDDVAVEPGDDTSPGGPLPLVGSTDILAAIESDLRKLDPVEQEKTRYFTLHVASNAGAEGAQLETQRKAFKKTINSLSTKSALIQPVAVDKDKLVYRINLDDMNTTPAEFDQVIADHYPFQTTYLDVGSADSIANEETDQSLRRLLATDFYLIRMDWWNATATLPILYEKFLQLPPNLSDFEEQVLGNRVSLNSLSAAARSRLDDSLIIRQGNTDTVDRRIANILNDQVTRSGFDNSNVSFSNRIIEHHPISEGSYWISYDFFNLKLGDNLNGAPADQQDLDEHNINKTPLGPKGINNGSLEFNHDGGEVIYSLPNGLFGYYLINAAGDLLDKGPINVVRQLTAPGEFGTAITNGLSCMSCHNAGLIKQADTIATGVGQNKQNLAQEDLSRINRIYNSAAVNRLIDQENVKYFAALNALGIDPKQADPVDQTFRFYNRPLTKKDILAELEISDRDFGLLLVDPEFSGVFNPLNNETGFINRAVFQAIMPSVMLKFKQEIQLGAPQAADFVVTNDCMLLDVFQMDECVIVNNLQLNLNPILK